MLSRKKGVSKPIALKKKVSNVIKKAERKGTIIQSNRGESSPHSVSNDEGSTSNRGYPDSMSEMKTFIDDSFRRHNEELRIEFKGLVKESETVLQTKLQSIQFKNEEFMKQVLKYFNDMENVNKQRFDVLNKKFDSLMQIGELSKQVTLPPVLQPDALKAPVTVTQSATEKPEVPPAIDASESPRQERNHKIVKLPEQSPN